MPSQPLLPPRVRSVVVVRALAGIGDHLCAMPALRALRRGLPGAHIAVLTVDGARDVLSRFSEYVDESIPFAGFPGIPEKEFDPAALPGFYQRMVERRFDLAIQMQGNGLVANSLVAMLGARHTAGYHLPGLYRPEEGRFIRYPEHLPEIRRHLALMDSLGFPSQGEHVSFPVNARDRTASNATLEAMAPGWRGAWSGAAGYACVHAGAAAESRRWSPEGFALVADYLAEEGLLVLFTGKAGEIDLVRGIQQRMVNPSLNLAGMTALGPLAALLEGATLVVCNDTGVSHLAAAVRTPSVVVFAGTHATGSDPLRWAPLDADLHRVVCRHAGGDDPQPVSVPRVLQAVQEQLDRYGRQRRAALGGRPALETAHVA